MSNSDIGRCRAASARTSLRPRRRRRRAVGRNHPSTQRSSGCRDNLQQPVAPRRQGSRAPSLQSAGVLGPLPCVQCPRWFESTSWSGLAVRPLSLWDASPGVLSQPPLSLGRFQGRRPSVLSRLLSYSVGLPATRSNLVGLKPGQTHLQCARDQSSQNAVVRKRDRSTLHDP